MGALWQTDSHQAQADSPSATPLAKKLKPAQSWRRLYWMILLMALIALGFAATREMHTAHWQARTFSRLTSAWATAPWVSSCRACSSATI